MSADRILAVESEEDRLKRLGPEVSHYPSNEQEIASVKPGEPFKRSSSGRIIYLEPSTPELGIGPRIFTCERSASLCPICQDLKHAAANNCQITPK